MMTQSVPAGNTLRLDLLAGMARLRLSRNSKRSETVILAEVARRREARRGLRRLADEVAP